MEDRRVRARVRVDGVVQGVFFRAETVSAASAAGLDGWVRNTSDGAVEAVFEGADDAVRRAIDWTRHGPRRAVVSSVDVTWEEPEGLAGFGVRY